MQKKVTSYVDYVSDFQIFIGRLVHRVRTSAAQSSLKCYDVTSGIRAKLTVETERSTKTDGEDP